MKPLILFTAQYLFLAAPAVTLGLLLALPAPRRLRLLVRLAVGGGLAVLLSLLAGHLYFSPRPFTLDHRPPLFPHAPDNGLPSDHTTLTMLLALLAFPFSRGLGAVLTLLSLLIAAARVASRVHSPVDILAAIGVAALSAGIAAWLEPRLTRGRSGGRQSGGRGESK